MRRNRLCKERWKQESEACEFHRCQSRRATWWILCDANKSTTSATLIEDEAGAEAKSNVKESSRVFLLFRSPTCRGTGAKGEGVVVKEISLVVPGTYASQALYNISNLPHISKRGSGESRQQGSAVILTRKVPTLRTMVWPIAAPLSVFPTLT